MMEFEHIIYEPVDGRARITLNRPEKRNALSIPLLQELSEALWEADNDTLFCGGRARHFLLDMT